MIKARLHKGKLCFTAIVLFLFVIIIVSAPKLFQGVFPTPHFAIVEKYAAENHLRPVLVYSVMKTESGFRADALSHKGAMGLMQITEKTGQWIATMLEYPDYKTEMLLEPEVNIRFGCWYLSYLLERFEGNSELALAAYNAGEGTVARWMESNQIEWRNLQIKSVPYHETENYLMRVNRIYFVYKTLYPELDS